MNLRNSAATVFLFACLLTFLCPTAGQAQSPRYGRTANQAANRWQRSTPIMSRSLMRQTQGSPAQWSQRNAPRTVLPRGRSYYQGRYFGNYNNRFYGPQYGYF